MNYLWYSTDPEQMLRHMANLDSQLSVITALLKSRDEYGTATPTSTRIIAEAEALLAQRPEIKQEAEAVS